MESNSGDKAESREAQRPDPSKPRSAKIDPQRHQRREGIWAAKTIEPRKHQ